MVQTKDILLLLIGAFIGWVFSIPTNWVNLRMTATSEKRKVCRVLIPEIQFNERMA
jgi:hypothetical protein